MEWSSTNQKVAGSSPAERANESPAKAALYFPLRWAVAGDQAVTTTYGAEERTMEEALRECIGFIGVLETLRAWQPVEILGSRTTLVIGIVSTDRLGPAEEASPETIHSVMLYVRQRPLLCEGRSLEHSRTAL
jgi:hypothetical protein